MPFFLWIYHERTSFHCICSNKFKLGIDFSKKVKSIPILPFQVFLKLFICHFISFFIFAILRQVLLNCIICKMNTCKVILDRILKRSCPDIPFLIPVTLHNSIDRGHHYVVPNIKFPSLIQKWFLQIALNNVGLEISIIVPLFLF